MVPPPSPLHTLDGETFAGANDTFFVVAEVAEADMVAGTIAMPLYASDTTVALFETTTELDVPPPALNCAELVESLIERVTGFAYVPGIASPDASSATTLNGAGRSKRECRRQPPALPRS